MYRLLYLYHHSMKKSYNKAKKPKTSTHRCITQPTHFIPSTTNSSSPYLLPPSRKIHLQIPPPPNTPRHENHRSNNQPTSNNSPHHNPRNLLGIKRRAPLDLEPVRFGREASAVLACDALSAGDGGVEPEGVASVRGLFVRGGGWNGWNGLIGGVNGVVRRDWMLAVCIEPDLPLVLQCRHFPELARGAGAVVGEVVDSVHGVPAVVCLVDEEEFVYYLWGWVGG
jgi:hypothetical protein